MKEQGIKYLYLLGKYKMLGKQNTDDQASTMATAAVQELNRKGYRVISISTSVADKAAVPTSITLLYEKE